MVKLAKAANKQATQKKKAPPPPKEVEEESSEEESSEEDVTPPPKVVKKATPAKATPAKATPAKATPARATPAKATPVVKNGAAAKKAESEEDGDSDEESEEETPPPKKTPAKGKPAKAAPAKVEESDDEDEDDDESEEEAPPPKKAAKPAAKAPVKAKPAKESSEEDESEEEAPPPKKKATPAKPAAKKAAKAAKEESDDDDDDEDESEEEMDTTPAPAKAKKAGMVKAKEDSEEEEEDDDEEEEDDDDDDDEEEAPVISGKRKADNKKDSPAAKKAKAEGEGFCLFVGNLNSNKDFDEIKDAMKKFFTKNGLEVVDVRLGGSKKFGYVEFSSEEDMQKAMELNGKKFMGQELKLDRARSKDSSQEGKKERDARTLFVKNLPFSATAEDLKEVFEDAVDVRLPPGQNGSNRGIAYIEFKTEAEAEKMLEEAQGADVQGRSIMVDYVGDKSQKGPTTPVAGAASKTLVVNNLSFTATEEALQATFEKAVSIRIPQRDGRPKGFAFLEFETTEEATDALENLNNTDIDGRSVRLEYSQNSGRDGARGNAGPTKTLFVKGLSEDTVDQTLKDAFDGAAAARIVTDRETGSSKGFGFVDFNSEDDCKAAKEAMDDGEIDGRKVTLDYARPKGESGFRGGRGGGGFGGGGRGGRGGRGGFGGGGFGGRGGGGGGGRGRGAPRGGGGRGGRGSFGGGRGGGGFGAKPQGKKTKFDD
ncbi:nucleolin [Pseudoliparis swirei]|uniref:nucleolin n=1 Tax=Pseudoliparis swirei TaxID=2059687 RepID=UPI0024BDB295|nr:nucleolin [Pseudoliparis swirei]